MKIPRKQQHWVRLSQQCRADITWWSLFIVRWNGIGILEEHRMGPKVVSDAPGGWGCGAYVGDSLQWFQLQWPPMWEATNIAVKELVPIVIAAALWGQHWEGTRVQFHSDNQAVVAALSKQSARDPHMMHLLRCMFFFSAHFQFEYQVQHLPRRDNQVADTLSRNHLDTFRSLLPQAPQVPKAIPQALSEMLLDLALT